MSSGGGRTMGTRKLKRKQATMEMVYLQWPKTHKTCKCQTVNADSNESGKRAPDKTLNYNNICPEIYS